MDPQPSTGERHPVPPAARPQATAATEQLSLPLPWGEPGNRLDMALDRGATYRLVCRVEKQKQQLLEYLEQLEGVAIVSRNGGLLNQLSLRENLLLPSAYHGTDVSNADLERDVADILRQCGLDAAPEALAAWLGGSPSLMGRLERRLAGYARALLARPEILVLDHVFEGLTRDEARRVLGWRKIFHRYLPFRTLLFVDLDFQGLPDLDDCISASAADADH